MFYSSYSLLLKLKVQFLRLNEQYMQSIPSFDLKNTICLKCENIMVVLKFYSTILLVKWRSIFYIIKGYKMYMADTFCSLSKYDRYM